MFKRIAAIVVLGTMVQTVSAQISRGGQPVFSDKQQTQGLPYFVAPQPDIEALKREDDVFDEYESIPYRFGANIEVDLGSDTDGTWDFTAAGDRVWRIAIHSPGAVSLNFRFDVYDIPDGARVFVYAPDHSEVLGGFTNENASALGALGVGLIQGDRIIIEYFEPQEHIGAGRLHIDQLTHGYRNIFGGRIAEAKGQFGNSGPCNINANCPEGLPYDIQKRSVALIVNNGNSVCSGALVNNTLEDGTPYFLTAEHCLPNNPNDVDNWIFYFNHESPTCAGSDGPTNQSISGATYRAANTNSDFALVELSSVPPAGYNVCYSGWDATDMEATVSNAYGIHHPSGDVKKICFEDDAPYHDAVSWINHVWFVDGWEAGVTEGGSSGSPLFNQAGMIIGQLGGGTAHCVGSGSTGYDYYGRFGASWSDGQTALNSLQPWLDPNDSGILIMPNSCGAFLPENSAAIFDIPNASGVLCNNQPFNPEIGLINLGSNNITQMAVSLTLNGVSVGSFEWTGILEHGETTYFSPYTVNPLIGDNQLLAEVISINGDPFGDSTFETEFTAYENAAEINIHITFDNYSDETRWKIEDEFGNILYQVPYYPEGTAEVIETVCLPSGCYVFTMIDQWGDGICCQWGEGSYTVTNSGGEILASGGDFGESESTEICLSVGTSNRLPEGDIQLYPNPSTGKFSVDFTSTSGNDHLRGIRVYDLGGRLVAEIGNLNGPTTEMDVSQLEAGVYLVEIETIRGRISEKLVLHGR